MATATVYQRSFIPKGALKPDPGRVRDQLEILQGQWAELGPPGFSENYCWILRKNPEPGEKDLLAGKGKWWNRRLIPFKHNRIQLNLDEEIFHWDVANKKWKGARVDKNTGKIIVPQSVKRNIMLKPRQAGYTTFFLIMRLLIPTILEPGTTSLLISQNSVYAAMHFSMVKRALRYFAVMDPYNQQTNKWSKELHQHVLHEAYSNRHEVIFDQIDSRIICASAEVEEVGQGVTLQHVQCTEVARWEGNPEETMANMKEAIAAEGTLDLESTANGHGGYFFEECQRSMDPKNQLAEFKFHFHEWWWHEEYARSPKKYRVSQETLTEEERTLIKKAKLSLGQIAFRREKKIALRHNFDEKYPEDPQSCFLVSGNTYFDRDILRARYLELRPNDQMLWYNPEAKYRKLQVFERRVKGRNYVIGADPATGKATSSGDPDFSAAVVVDQTTGKEMAAYRARIPADEFAFDLAELARSYNDAHIAVERMGDGGVVITTLEVQCQYMNIYKHKDLFKRDRKRIIEMYGFPTTTKTRPLGLAWLKSFLNKFPELIFDVRFLDEAFTFVFNDNGKPEAAEGCHDDTVLCRAIAHYVRMVRNGYYDPIFGYTASYKEEVEDEDVEAEYGDLSEEDVAP